MGMLSRPDRRSSGEVETKATVATKTAATATAATTTSSNTASEDALVVFEFTYEIQ